MKDGMECGVGTVGESETLCALSGGFSASSLRSIASDDPRRTGAGASRTVGAWTSCWVTLDIVRARSRWFVWSASRIGSNVGIGYGQSWNKSSILQTTWPMRRRCITQRAHILDRRRCVQLGKEHDARQAKSLPAVPASITRVLLPRLTTLLLIRFPSNFQPLPRFFLSPFTTDSQLTHARQSHPTHVLPVILFPVFSKSRVYHAFRHAVQCVKWPLRTHSNMGTGSTMAIGHGDSDTDELWAYNR